MTEEYPLASPTDLKILASPTENQIALDVLRWALNSGYRPEIYRLNVRLDSAARAVILSPADLPAEDSERGSAVGNTTQLFTSTNPSTRRA